jgi:hypothetical protein
VLIGVAGQSGECLLGVGLQAPGPQRATGEQMKVSMFANGGTIFLCV